MFKKIKIILQYLLPKQWLTELIGWGAQLEGGYFTRGIIMLFIRCYNVNMQEAQKSNIAAYPTFNAFFTRELHHQARPIHNDPSVLVLPADGIIQQFGLINENKIFPIKGHKFNITELLAGNTFMISQFSSGIFTVIYLAPHDYHRVHMPCNGVLREMFYIPGDLFSVNPLTVAHIPNVFARNERVICLFDTDFGLMVQILIGAIFVGSINTVWAGTITPPRQAIIQRWHYPPTNNNGAVVLLKGQEMGSFKLGSTVINLFTDKNVVLGNHLYINYVTRVGQHLANGIILD